jgi:1-acyl-sn-glycerol-3-phosphate acyltransferase
LNLGRSLREARLDTVGIGTILPAACGLITVLELHGNSPTADPSAMMVAAGAATGAGLVIGFGTSSAFFRAHQRRAKGYLRLSMSTLVGLALAALGLWALAHFSAPALSAPVHAALLGLAAAFGGSLLATLPLLATLVPTATHHRPQTVMDLIRTILLYSIIFSGCGVRLLVLPLLCLLFGQRGQRFQWQLDRLVYRTMSIASSAVRGREPESLPEPVLIVANHQSQADMFAMLGVRPDVCFITKSWVPWVPLLGWVARRMGNIFFEESDLDSIEAEVEDRINQGRPVVFFAEAHRQIDERIHRLHAGVFHIASRLDLPVVPALFTGTGKVSPRGTSWMRRYPWHVHFLDRQMPPDDDSPRSVSLWAREVRELMQSAAAEEVSRLLHSDVGLDAVARHYLHQGRPYETRALELIEDDPERVRLTTQLPERGAMLDIGCGQGLSSVAVVAWSGDRSVVALDANASEIESARTACPYERARFVHTSFRDWAPLESERFDGALILQDWSDWSSAERKAAVEKLALLLLPGALLILRESEEAPPTSGEETRTRLERYGFTEIEVRAGIGTGSPRVVYSARFRG